MANLENEKKTVSENGSQVLTTTASKMIKNNRLVAFVRIPIFKLTSKPILYMDDSHLADVSADYNENTNRDIKAKVENGLCNFCQNSSFRKPTSRFKNKHMNVKLGSRVVMECVFDGGYHPRPVNVYWFKYYNQINKNITRFSFQTNNVYVFVSFFICSWSRFVYFLILLSRFKVIAASSS